MEPLNYATLLYNGMRRSKSRFELNNNKSEDALLKEGTLALLLGILVFEIMG